MSLTLNII